MRPGDQRIDIPVRIHTAGQQGTIFDEVARQRPDRMVACALVDGDSPAVRLLGVVQDRAGHHPVGASPRRIFACLEDPRTGDRVACSLDDLEAACGAVREQLRDG